MDNEMIAQAITKAALVIAGAIIWVFGHTVLGPLLLIFGCW